MLKGTLVQHKRVTFLGKVEGEDPHDKKKVMVRPLTGNTDLISCHPDNLIELG